MIVSFEYRIIKGDSGTYKVQVPKTFLGLTYWSTVRKCYFSDTIEELLENYANELHEEVIYPKYGKYHKELAPT